ncbi:MAG TPA: methyl-accepting chemotaxis protein, partial [Burkholderiaceae bacterium]|nr:methyl-accepting chemotaxis protein [Burkholderiaceae bacterium]
MESKAPPASSQNKQHRSEGGFFAYHGLWAPGIRLFRELRFALKALILSALMLLPASALLLWQMQAQTDEALQGRKTATRQHVEVARGVLQWMHRQEQEGKLSREAAQAAAKSAIAALRYDKDEYFWINDLDARVVMHPTKPELDGKDGSGIKDPNGKALFLAFVAEVRQHGAGFVDYQWPRPGRQEPEDKLSYVSGFEPWGWVIGSGMYTDDLHGATRARLVLSALVMGPVMLLAFYLFVCFYRVMEGGLLETRRHLNAMTQGDLTTAPEPWGRDEAADLMLDLRAMQQSLVHMVQGVHQSSDEILNSSSEIANGAMDLSSRTEQTAANLEETAAAMEQISATVRQSTEHAQNATGIASHNAEVARHGGLVIAQMVHTMQDIQQSSNRINDIIGVIDSIAFQTNILALNAAVEAARAGEQGRGFAVVAAEVRALAQRSATAAKEIKSLITASVEKVEGGTRIAENAGETMGSVVHGAEQISQLLQQIATGAAEQSQGIAQVGQAVQELDRATQQNAAMVEETAAGASALKDEA